jgi:hypothetical protein
MAPGAPQRGGDIKISKTGFSFKGFRRNVAAARRITFQASLDRINQIAQFDGNTATMSRREIRDPVRPFGPHSLWDTKPEPRKQAD